MGLNAIELHYQMPSELIDELTYVFVSNACVHSGLVDQAGSIFSTITMKTKKIYATMIDCYSRAGLFEEAQQLIDEFECYHPPIWPMYMALLSGTRNKTNINLSEKIYNHMKVLFPELTDPLISATVLLANVYGSIGDIEKASDMRNQLNKLDTKKKIALSWISVNGKLFKFRGHDRSHPRSKEIYAELDKISKELTENGHQYDSSWITRSKKPNETIESILCGHSERLAIAFNFVENRNSTRIQVTENLRVYGDCRMSLFSRFLFLHKSSNKINSCNPTM